MSDFNEFDKPLAPEKETGSIISHAWENYMKVIAYAILLTVGTWVLSTVISTIFETVLGIKSTDPELIKEAMKTKNYGLIFSSPAFAYSTSISSIIGILLFPLYAGFMYMVHKASQNKEVAVNDLFFGYRQNTLQFILYGILSSMIISLGLLFCLVPGVILGAMLFIALPVMLFENKNAIQGIQKSFEISKNHLGTFLGFSIVAFLITISGFLLCCIGYIATAPFIYAAMYSAYSAYCGNPYEVVNK
jgi:uncharacterized membrane protein